MNMDNEDKILAVLNWIEKARIRSKAPYRKLTEYSYSQGIEPLARKNKPQKEGEFKIFTRVFSEAIGIKKNELKRALGGLSDRGAIKILEVRDTVYFQGDDDKWNDGYYEIELGAKFNSVLQEYEAIASEKFWNKNDDLGSISKNPEKRDEFLTYFDLCFDFENGEYWKFGQRKKHPLQITDDNGNKTNYHSFQVLLENKGIWLTKEEIESKGFKFQDVGSVINCNSLDNYLRKNLHSKLSISDEDIFKTPRGWLKYDKKEGKIMLVSDKNKNTYNA